MIDIDFQSPAVKEMARQLSESFGATKVIQQGVQQMTQRIFADSGMVRIETKLDRFCAQMVRDLAPVMKSPALMPPVVKIPAMPPPVMKSPALMPPVVKLNVMAAQIDLQIKQLTDRITLPILAQFDALPTAQLTAFSEHLSQSLRFTFPTPTVPVFAPGGGADPLTAQASALAPESGTFNIEMTFTAIRFALLLLACQIVAVAIRNNDETTAVITSMVYAWVNAELNRFQDRRG